MQIKAESEAASTEPAPVSGLGMFGGMEIKVGAANGANKEDDEGSDSDSDNDETASSSDSDNNSEEEEDDEN